jgi:hypothetical protein
MRRLMTTFWWYFSGVPLLLVISLYGLYSHGTEWHHRHEVENNGTQTTASLVRSSGIESVLVTWTDLGGRSQTANAWTGKPFARLARAGQDVAIKYVPESTLEPVILSEAAEREGVNEWWILRDAWVALAMTIICAVIAWNVLITKSRASARSMFVLV